MFCSNVYERSTVFACFANCQLTQHTKVRNSGTVWPVDDLALTIWPIIICPGQLASQKYCQGQFGQINMMDNLMFCGLSLIYITD